MYHGEYVDSVVAILVDETVALHDYLSDSLKIELRDHPSRLRKLGEAIR
jgi:hypothetical protein